MALNISKALSDVGNFFTEAFKDVTQVAVTAEPFVDLAFPSAAKAYNTITGGCVAARTAAQKAINPNASETENMVSVVAAVEPVFVSFSKASGLASPTVSQIVAYSQAVVAAAALAGKVLAAK